MGEDDYSKVMNRKDSTAIDIERIREPKELELSKSPKRKKLAKPSNAASSASLGQQGTGGDIVSKPRTF